MKTLLSFLVGLLVGAMGYRFITTPQSGPRLADMEHRVQPGASNALHTIRDHLDPETIKDELARTGRVIREKTAQAGDALADATANARITAAIKTKLVQDSGLAAFAIDVDTTDGRVTLSGTVSSHDAIARAVKLALETEGVRTVVSTLQVKPARSDA